MLKDTYKTIENSFEGSIYKDRGSKFIGYIFPISNSEDALNYISKIKKKHHKARHWCYAWKIGVETIEYRVNDDGEPNNSAGQPIYGQILSFDLTNVLVIVVRYFGGIKLGVGGLITAYKNAARLVIESSLIIEKTIDVCLELKFDYENLNKIMRIIKEKQLSIVFQQMEMRCLLKVLVRKKDSELIISIFENLNFVNIRQIEV